MLTINYPISPITLDTLGNPGWSICIPVSHATSVFVTEDNSNSDWLIRYYHLDKWHIVGDETKLVRIFHETLKYFNIPLTPELEELVPLIEFVQTWYARECDEYWEHLYGVSATINENGQCHIVIDLEETYWEDYALINPIGSPDTFQCYTNELKFIGDGQLEHIKVFLETFKAWIEYCLQRSE